MTLFEAQDDVPVHQGLPSPGMGTTDVNKRNSLNQSTALEDLLELRQSAVHGIGAFARRGLQSGAALGRYGGRHHQRGDPVPSLRTDAVTYLFGLSNGTVIDGSDGGNALGFLNHSCCPNCAAMETLDEDGELWIEIATRQRIRAGEELFIDYALDIGNGDPAAYPCRCGAPGCRSTLALRPE